MIDQINSQSNEQSNKQSKKKIDLSTFCLDTTSGFMIKPETKIAKKLGCHCKKNKAGTYDLEEYCPIHWPLVIITKINNISTYIEKKDSQHTVLLYGLLLSVIVTFLFFLIR